MNLNEFIKQVDLAKELGVSTKAIRERARLRGLAGNRVWLGERMHVLYTPEQVEKIKAPLPQGAKPKHGLYVGRYQRYKEKKERSTETD
jgi:hypothetical protein